MGIRSRAGGGISVVQVGDWDKAFGILGGMSNHFAMQELLERAMFNEAQFARAMLVKGIQAGAPGGRKFKPHSPTTMLSRRFGGKRASRGAGKPMIQSGGLMRGINVRRVRGEGSFTGILRSQYGADGTNLVNLMALHERGKVIAIKVTDQMRAYLMAMFRQGGLASAGAGKGGIVRGVIIVRIPARPVFAPVWQKYFRPAETKARVVAFVKANLLSFSLGLIGRARGRI